MGQDSTLDKERQKLKERIIKLRGDGYSNKAIAEELGLSVAAITMRVHRLIQEGRVERGSGSGRSTCRDIDSERVQTIIAMQKQRATLKEIGHALGVTRERARQLTKKIIAECGQEVFEPDARLWTMQKAAQELGVDHQIIYLLCASGEVVARRRGISCTYLIEEDDVEKLRRHPAITRERVCGVCHKVFVYQRKHGSRTVCSDTCQGEWSRQKRAAYAEQTPTPYSLRRWHKDLWQKLQSHHLPKNEEWFSIREAARRTGLSNGQLVWLRRRNIVTVRPHPVKKWRGQPVMMYAASEMEIARQVFEVYQQRNGTHG